MFSPKSKNSKTSSRLINESSQVIHIYNLRPCPSCGLKSLSGMPGGREAVCKNCGYKDPCCYD